MKKLRLKQIPNVFRVEIDVRDGSKDYFMDRDICEKLYKEGKLDFDSTNNAFLDENRTARQEAEKIRPNSTHNKEYEYK